MKNNLNKDESVNFMANRALMQRFATSVDQVFDIQGRKCGIRIDHRFARAIAGNNEYVVDCIAPVLENFIEFEKKYLDSFCRGFKDVIYSVNDRQLSDGLHRIYSFSEGRWTESSIMISEEVRIPGTDIILEAGDCICLIESSNDLEAQVLKIQQDLAKYNGSSYDILSILVTENPQYQSYKGKRAKLDALNMEIRKILKKHGIPSVWSGTGK